MARSAGAQQGRKDAQLRKVNPLVEALLRDGFQPILFCRVIPTAEYVAAVRRVGMGMTMFEPRAQQPEPLLSEREREVLELIAAGSTNREIAQRLYLSPHTVKEHTSAVYRKLHARNRAEALHIASERGWL